MPSSNFIDAADLRFHYLQQGEGGEMTALSGRKRPRNTKILADALVDLLATKTMSVTEAWLNELPDDVDPLTFLDQVPGQG